MEPDIWIVGKNVEGKGAWEFLGVFTNKIEAIKHAIRMSGDSCFIGPAVINEKLSEEEKEWVGCFFPKILKLWYDSKYKESEWSITPTELITAKQEKDNILKAYEEINK